MRRARGGISSDAEEGIAHEVADLLGEDVPRPVMAHAPHLDHVEVVAHLDRLGDVLIHQEDRRARVACLEQPRVDLLGDLRRQPGGRLVHEQQARIGDELLGQRQHLGLAARQRGDRKSTRLNSSHGYISYAAFCLKKTTTTYTTYCWTL